MAADPDEEEPEKKFRALDEGDIALLKTYGLGPYSNGIKAVEDDIKKLNTRINEVVGIKESDTGLAPPAQWDLISDKQMRQEEQPLQVRAPPEKRAEPAGRGARACRGLARRARRRGGGGGGARAPSPSARAPASPPARRWRAAPRSSTRTRTTPST